MISIAVHCAYSYSVLLCCTGKTSLLRCLTGERVPDSGTITPVHESVVFGYNSQSREALDETKPVWAEIVGQDTVEVAITPEFALPARAYVAQFNFSGQDQSKLVGALSGEQNHSRWPNRSRKGAMSSFGAWHARACLLALLGCCLRRS